MRAYFFDHVELPENVYVELTGQFLVLVRPVVCSIAKTFRVDTEQLAAVAYVIKLLPFHQGRRTNALIRPVVHAARREFLVRRLPKKLAVRLAKRHENAPITPLLGIAKSFIVCTHKDLSI